MARRAADPAARDRPVSKTKTTAVAVGLPAVLFATLIGLVLLLAAAALTPAQACQAAGPALALDDRTLPSAPIAGYGGAQLENAALIMHAAQAKGLDLHAQTVGVMTAMGESSLQVLDRGDAAGPDSRGLFQQRANGAWGSLAARMNPTVSATNFFTALTAVPGWEPLPPTIAAHRVQANADPYYYAPFWDPAVQVVQAVGGATVHPGTSVDGGSSTCGASGVINQAAVTAGGWSNPLPGAVETQPFGSPRTAPTATPASTWPCRPAPHCWPCMPGPWCSPGRRRATASTTSASTSAAAWSPATATARPSWCRSVTMSPPASLWRSKGAKATAPVPICTSRSAPGCGDRSRTLRRSWPPTA